MLLRRHDFLVSPRTHPQLARPGLAEALPELYPYYPSEPTRRAFGTLRAPDNLLFTPGTTDACQHPYQRIEVLTVLVQGSLHHRDTTGHHGVLTEDTVQLLSAGSGLDVYTHNHSATEEADVLQLWLAARHPDAPPRVQTLASPPERRHGRFRLPASPGGAAGSLCLNQAA